MTKSNQNIVNILRADDISVFLSLWLKNRSILSSESNAVFSKYYQSYLRYFGPYIMHQYKQQSKELMEYIEQNPTLKVLEIGCGCGTESLWMALHGINVTSIDINEERLSVANERKQLLEDSLGKTLPVEFHLQSILEMEEIEFDVIWMEQTFHHLEPREEVLSTLYKLLKKGGKIIISDTNALNPLVQLQYFLQRGFKTVKKVRGYVYGNERVTTPRLLKRKMDKYGFNNIVYRYFRIMPNKRFVDLLKFNEPKLCRPLTFLYTHYNIIANK